MSEDNTPELNSAANETAGLQQSHATGEIVRTHDEEGLPEDSWQYYGKNEETGTVTVMQVDPSSNQLIYKELPGDVFLIWQQEKQIYDDYLIEEVRRIAELIPKKLIEVPLNKTVSAFGVAKNAVGVARLAKRIKDTYRKSPGPELGADTPAAAPEGHRQLESDDFIEPEDAADEPEETIEEDADDIDAEPSGPEDPVSAYLHEAGIDGANAREVREILGTDLSELVRRHLSSIGVEPQNLEQTAQLLVPRELYLKKLHELGMPESSDEPAHKLLVEGKGRLRLKHLVELVGGKEGELRQLMKTHRQDLLAEELKKLGFDDEKIKEISDTPRRNKSKLTQEALRRLGFDDGAIAGIELAAALAEIPPDIAQGAAQAGITLEILVKAREAFKRADWKDTFDYLQLAKNDERVREQLRQHGIEVEPAPVHETNNEKIARLKNMTLKEINEEEPGEWEAERARRVARKKEELAVMLERFKDYLPLKDLPLPSDVEVPPEMKIPDDLLGAYGLWKRLLIDTYTKRIGDERGYRGVRAEAHRVGGPVPGLRKIRQRLLAIRILQEQKKQARETGHRGSFGAFGVGYSRYKQNFRSVEDADIKVQDILRALDVFHKPNFISDGQDTPRKRLAENIVAAKLRELAFREGKLNPVPPHAVKRSSEAAPDDEGLV